VHPRNLPPFTVIRIPFLFGDGQTYRHKLFVVSGHYDNSAFCIKPTSRTGFFDNNPDKICGCVCYAAREVDFLPKRTIIDPDNQFEIPHPHLADLQERGELGIVGRLPDSFGERLKAAVANSQTLDRRRRAWLRAVLPGY
jgi:hypothetical protein